MKVFELKTLLEQCKDDADVEMILNASMVDREPSSEDDGVEYGYSPEMTVTWKNRECSGLADCLNIMMPSA